MKFAAPESWGKISQVESIPSRLWRRVFSSHVLAKSPFRSGRNPQVVCRSFGPNLWILPLVPLILHDESESPFLLVGKNRPLLLENHPLVAVAFLGCLLCENYSTQKAPKKGILLQLPRKKASQPLLVLLIHHNTTRHPQHKKKKRQELLSTPRRQASR